MTWGYRLVHLRETPPGTDWLSDAERRILERLPAATRREEWLGGRWAAKTALAVWLDRPLGAASLRRLEVITGADRGPRLLVDDAPDETALSLSHRAGFALALIGAAELALGCDLERTEPRSRLFVREYFTDGERQLVETAPDAHRDRLANLIWSAKESALKLLRTGLTVPTRTVEAMPVPDDAAPGGWARLTVAHLTDDERFTGWWRSADDLLLTVLSRPPLPPPREL